MKQNTEIVSRFAVLKNMLMRLKQFQYFISVLFHHVRRVLVSSYLCSGYVC